jgi:hypothetical protein
VSAGRLPNLLVIGAMKAGTTSLHRYLDAHPDVFMSDTKELQFFSEHNWGRGLAWYESQFAPARGQGVLGEASPSYARYPFSAEARDRIAETVPGARLLYIVREPIERIVSQHQHLTEYAGERRPLDEAALDEDVYLSTSRYAMQADRYLERFPREQLHVVVLEQLRRSPREELAKVFEFLGVDPDVSTGVFDKSFGRADQRRKGPAVVDKVRGNGAYRRVRQLVPSGARDAVWRAVTRPSAPPEPSVLSPQVRAEMLDRLRPDLERLPALLGADFDCWGLLG